MQRKNETQTKNLKKQTKAQFFSFEKDDTAASLTFTFISDFCYSHYKLITESKSGKRKRTKYKVA